MKLIVYYFKHCLSHSVYWKFSPVNRHYQNLIKIKSADNQHFTTLALKLNMHNQNNEMKNSQKLKFFIVDDDPFCRMLYQQHLINLGFKNNILFDNGADCINQLTEKPDVIFLDYDMKPYNGLEVLRMVKRLYPEIHLLIISSQKDMQVAINAFKYGAYDYIVKGEKDLETISLAVNKILISKEHINN
jgi:PleD family two-component response regulator